MTNKQVNKIIINSNFWKLSFKTSKPIMGNHSYLKYIINYENFVLVKIYHTEFLFKTAIV